MKNGRTARLVFAGVAASLLSLVVGITEVEVAEVLMIFLTPTYPCARLILFFVLTRSLPSRVGSNMNFTVIFRKIPEGCIGSKVGLTV